MVPSGGCGIKALAKPGETDRRAALSYLPEQPEFRRRITTSIASAVFWHQFFKTLIPATTDQGKFGGNGLSEKSGQPNTGIGALRKQPRQCLGRQSGKSVHDGLGDEVRLLGQEMRYLF